MADWCPLRKSVVPTHYTEVNTVPLRLTNFLCNCLSYACLFRKHKPGLSSKVSQKYYISLSHSDAEMTETSPVFKGVNTLLTNKRYLKKERKQ